MIAGQRSRCDAGGLHVMKATVVLAPLAFEPPG